MHFPQQMLYRSNQSWLNVSSDRLKSLLKDLESILYPRRHSKRPLLNVPRADQWWGIASMALNHLWAYWVHRTTIGDQLIVHVERQDQIEVGCLLPSCRCSVFSPCFLLPHNPAKVECFPYYSIEKLMKDRRKSIRTYTLKSASFAEMELCFFGISTCCHWATIRIAPSFQRNHPIQRKLQLFYDTKPKLHYSCTRTFRRAEHSSSSSPA